MRIALVQLNSGNDPEKNLPIIENYISEAKSGGAEFILTPENTNCLSSNSAKQLAVIHHQDDDPTLKRMRELAAELKVWLLLGSLSFKVDDPDGRTANRSVLISPDGKVKAQYDKIHMFDVDLGNDEVYKESALVRPGEKAVLAQTSFGKIGMSICYDLRFPSLFRALAKSGAQILTIPAAFTVPTGKAHWHTLLQARAIETGCFVLAPAQTGTHDCGGKTPRKTYGHSLVVSPWGQVLADGGETTGVTFADIDLNQVTEARKKMPSLRHDRTFVIESE